MSLKNNDQDPGYRLPTGGVLDEDLSSYSQEKLEHEFHLSYEVLHDIHCKYPPWNGGVAIKGMLKENPDECKFGREQFLSSLAVWKLRLARAEEELERRYLLS
jgi:hypothetical protein